MLTCSALALGGSWSLAEEPAPSAKELRAEDANGEIELTPREVSILSLLQGRSGEVVSRDELLNECWGIDYFPESRTLDQHISKLRKKLKDEVDASMLIETIRGVGYRCRSTD